MPQIETVSDHIFWSYANLARAHAALADGNIRYSRTHHIIRSRLFSGLKSGRMSIGSIYDDERLKMTLPQACSYCGSQTNLSLDHLVPRILMGSDEADNYVWACKFCNSSKQGRDLLVWMAKKDDFPSIFVLRRYIKIAYRRSETLGILEESLEVAFKRELPFALSMLPLSFPPLDKLVLWVAREPQTSDSKS